MTSSWFAKVLGTISKFFSLSEKKAKVFVISDTHFNHRKIIRYAKRPFPSVHRMNRAILRRWNKVVGKNDTVYFLGDFSFKYRHGLNTGYWITHLNGRKVFIEGNHDRGKNKIHGAFNHRFISYRGHKFYLIHDQKEAPIYESVWVIHGHSHNNRPFIDGEKKRINVSVEAIGYQPLDLDTLVELNLQKIKWMDTINSRPIRMGEP